MSEKRELTLSEEEDDISVVEGELLQAGEEDDVSTPLLLPAEDSSEGNQRHWLTYVLLPLIFLTSALLGGLRIAAPEGEFVFVTPALICLIFATLLLALFVRTGLINLQGWFSDSIPTLANAANGAVLLTLFAASVQMFNSLIPEQGLSFWVVAFCFLWTLGASFFTVGDPVKLVRSIVALFSFAFLTKYFILLNLTSTSAGGWLRRLWDDPTKEAVTYLLDLPRYAPATGYIQFFAAALFLLGLFLVRPDTRAALGEKQ
jgi:hypothetical protein